jgi:hypothetical protein
MYNGFYYHYKRNSSQPVEEGAYEVIGTAYNTESSDVHSNDLKDFEKDELVIYRPLYTDSLVYKAGKRFWVRPRSMFTELVEQNGTMVPRFQKITDASVIAALAQQVKQLYGEK